MSLSHENNIDPRLIRKKAGLNQQQFWSKIGVTQSGGSRYESGRNMPKPVQTLLHIVYSDGIDIQKLRREDWEIAVYMRNNEPGLFKRLKQDARKYMKALNKG